MIVKYLLSTSNHNFGIDTLSSTILSNIFFLHQTTTLDDHKFFSTHCQISSFYIKPQLKEGFNPACRYCQISSFYIKPQPSWVLLRRPTIVKYLLSTSNHNHGVTHSFSSIIVKYLLSTSNHNLYRIIHCFSM